MEIPPYKLLYQVFLLATLYGFFQKKTDENVA